MQKETIQFIFPVESVNRKMTLRKNTASSTMRYNGIDLQKPVARYMGSGTRYTSRKGVGVSPSNYLFVRFNKRSTQATSDEIQQRNRFGFVSAWVAATRKNLAIISSVLTSYNTETPAAGVVSTGLTFYQFIWLVRAAQYDNGVTTTTAPEYNQWPA